MANPVATANGRAPSAAANISTGVVGVVHEYTGRGPTKARTTIDQNTVIVMMGDTLTKSERKLAEDGKSDLVYEIRHQFQSTMREDLIEVVETALDRKVIAFMSANHLDPDLAAEVFVLQPVDPIT
jgi:uncharacterized protein YbcI